MRFLTLSPTTISSTLSQNHSPLNSITPGLMALPILTDLLKRPTHHSTQQPLPLKSLFLKHSATATRAQPRFTRSRDLQQRSLKTNGLAMPSSKALLKHWPMAAALMTGKPPLTNSSTSLAFHGSPHSGSKLSTAPKALSLLVAHSSHACKVSKPTSPSGNTAPFSTSAPGQVTAPLTVKSFSPPTVSSGRPSVSVAAVPLSLSVKRRQSAEVLQSPTPSPLKCGGTCKMPSSLATKSAVITTGSKSSSGG